MDIQDRAKEIAARANECCERSDGYEEAVESVALRHLNEAIERLTAENERLRAALVSLLEMPSACTTDEEVTENNYRRCHAAMAIDQQLTHKETADGQ